MREIQSKQEKVENKIHQHHIKKLQGYIRAMDSEPYRGHTTNKILDNKENTIQLLKKKLKFPSTRLIQAFELTELEKENESLSQELNDCKVKLLKHDGEQIQWEKEKGFVLLILMY